jgi:hypothetical protein
LHSPKTSPVPTFSAANHQPGDHVGVAHVPVRQQHLDQGAGALRVAEVGARTHPERLVRGCEHPRFAGLGQRRATGERAGLAHQHLQVVVQREYRIALGGAALGPGHQRSPSEISSSPARGSTRTRRPINRTGTG